MKYIVFSFIAFALFIGTLVAVCVKQDISLVSVNYYEEDLRYDHKLAQKKNAEALAEQPTVTVENQQLSVTFSQIASVEEGLIKLTRPSDSRLDQAFTFDGSLASPHSFLIAQPQKGLYRLSIQWKMNDKEYFLEKNIVL
ncbi:MAG: FixH family protein [Cytophagales bacterium]